MNNNITFIAEIGMNHNGNFSLCFELIKQAKLAGANVVKFQLGWRDKPGEINRLDSKIIKQLINWSKYFEIEIMFSIISDDAYRLIKPFKLKRYKIASRTVIENLPLIKKILKEKKQTIISLGMWNKKYTPLKKMKNISYLWCLSKYPCEPKDLKGLPKSFKNSHFEGYSDHSIGIETCLIAISRGAKIVEKHFTLDKSDTTIRDHALSATPNEFKQLVDLGTDISKKIDLGV